MKSALVATFATVALKAQTKAAQHLENCERRRRLFISAFSAFEESAEDEMSLLHSLGEGGVFGLTAKVIRELRTCPEWPAGT
jgi:hypothetical protein